MCKRKTSSGMHVTLVNHSIDIIHGTGLETHPINAFLMASPCYGGRGHVMRARYMNNGGCCYGGGCDHRYSVCSVYNIYAATEAATMEAAAEAATTEAATMEAATMEAATEATTASSELLRTAIQMVLKDDGFDIPSEPARKARTLAGKYLEWCQEVKNECDFQVFSEDLVKGLEACFTSLPTAKARRERMWERYFKYRSSSEFTHKWKDHLSAIEESPSPVFYQFLTDVIMEHLIKKHFPVRSDHVECSTTLDYEEHNAIRYTAGYVLRAIQRKINRSSHPLKEELALCLEELREQSNEFSHVSEEWLQAIDRGGLVHVNDMTYMLFTALEQALRPYLGSMQTSSELNIKEVSKLIQSDGNVLFYWSILSVNWEDEAADALLVMLVEQWITLRGFSSASALMEKYKQSCKKNLEKSKGVRKRLQTE